MPLMKHRRIGGQGKNAVVEIMAERFATEAEAMQPGTRKLLPGYFWGRGSEKGLIIRKA